MRYKEIARDVLALGSWVFYALVVARAFIKPYRPFLDWLVIGAVVLIVISVVFKKLKFEGYVARGMVLAVFTSLFYESSRFSIFAFLVFVGLLVSARYVGRKWLEIVYGIIVGVIGVLVGWYGVGLL